MVKILVLTLAIDCMRCKQQYMKYKSLDCIRFAFLHDVICVVVTNVSFLGDVERLHLRRHAFQRQTKVHISYMEANVPRKCNTLIRVNFFALTFRPAYSSEIRASRWQYFAISDHI